MSEKSFTTEEIEEAYKEYFKRNYGGTRIGKTVGPHIRMAFFAAYKIFNSKEKNGK